MHGKIRPKKTKKTDFKKNWTYSKTAPNLGAVKLINITIAEEMKKLVFDMLGEEGAKKARKEMRARGYAKDVIDSEIVADSLFDVLSEKGIIKEMSKETRVTVSEMLRHLSDSIREMLSRLTGTETWRIELRDKATNYRHLSNMFMNAMDTAADDVQRAELVEDIRGEVRYSIKYTTDNKPVVVVTENILDGVPESEWVKTVKDTIRNKFPNGIPISGRLIKVNKVTRSEYTNSVYTKKQQRVNKAVYVDKFKVANNLDEIVLATTNYINEDLNHSRKDTFKEFARGDVLISVDGKNYSAKVIVGFTESKEMVLYDVISFQRASFTMKKRISRTVQHNAENSSTVISSDNTISQNKGIVNTIISENSENDSTKRQSKKKTSFEIAKEYESPITPQDVETLRSIGRRSVNSFTGEDIRKASKWAYKFYKELGTKSPFFRAWFGDWRQYDKSPARFFTNIELLNITDTKSAVSYFKSKLKSGELFRGDVVNKDTNFKINIGTFVYNDTLTYANRALSRSKDVDLYRAEMSVINNIRDIVENAIYLETSVADGKKDNTGTYQSFYHYFYSLVQVDGKPYMVRLAVDEHNSSTTVRRAYNVESIEISPVAVSQVYKPAVTTSDNGEKLSTVSISDLFDIVKQYDKNFSPKPVSPEFVNDDGTPKVWYHSTNADFTSFKRGSGVLGDGIYFSDYSQGLYGKNIMEAYLTAENPINLRSLPRGAKEINSVGIETSVIPNFFEKFPQYDAIMDSRHGEIVVKNSEQIKSATDNIGTFDKGNKDIRFSKKKEPVKALKAEDVFGKDYKAEYAALKEETENIRKEIAVLATEKHIDDGYKDEQTERLTKILKNKEALLKRMDSLRTILAQLQARNANVSRYAKLFLDNFQAVKKTGSYRATGENWEIMKAVSEITATYEPVVSDFATRAGLAKLQKEHKQIYDAFMAYARDKAYIRPFNLSECKSVLEKLAKEYKAEGADISGLAAELKNAVEIYLNKAADKQPSYEALVREFDVILSDITEKSEKLADKSEWAQKIKGQTVKLVGDQYRNVIDTFGSLAEANRYMNGAVKFSLMLVFCPDTDFYWIPSGLQ